MAYSTITTIFQKYDSDLSAAEAHGLATGMLCLANKTEATIWLAELFEQDITLLDDDKTILVALFEQTQKLMSEEENMYRYDLFLPGDDELLGFQMKSLCSWCEGFLFGVGHNRLSSTWPKEIAEIMKDIIEFTKLDTDIDEDMDEKEKNEHEAALMEIQEYLRAAVNMIKDQYSDNKVNQH